MKYIGAHVSAAGGVENAPLNAQEIGATAFALFVKNQKQWSAPPLTAENISNFKKNCEKYSYTPEQILPHDSYLINLGNPEREARQRSLESFLLEVQRCEQLGLKYLNFHPGSHLKKISEEESLKYVAENLNITLDKSKGITLVIETTAGQGSNLGYKFEHIAFLIDQITDKKRIAVCLDTCHSYSAGYDLKNKYAEVFNEFDRIIGLKYLKAFHLNDDKKELGSKVDRHEGLGQGTLGWELFKKLIQDDRFDEHIFILETPVPENWPQEIKKLKELLKK